MHLQKISRRYVHVTVRVQERFPYGPYRSFHRLPILLKMVPSLLLTHLQNVLAKSLKSSNILKEVPHYCPLRIFLA